MNKGPETCFIEGVGLNRSHLEPFISQKEVTLSFIGMPTFKSNKEILVWHTKPKAPKYNNEKVENLDDVLLKEEMVCEFTSKVIHQNLFKVTN